MMSSEDHTTSSTVHHAKDDHRHHHHHEHEHHHGPMSPRSIKNERQRAIERRIGSLGAWKYGKFVSRINFK